MSLCMLVCLTDHSVLPRLIRPSYLTYPLDVQQLLFDMVMSSQMGIPFCFVLLTNHFVESFVEALLVIELNCTFHIIVHFSDFFYTCSVFEPMYPHLHSQEAPAVIQSYFDKRIVGCPGGEGGILPYIHNSFSTNRGCQNSVFSCILSGNNHQPNMNIISSNSHCNQTLPRVMDGFSSA